MVVKVNGGGLYGADVFELKTFGKYKGEMAKKPDLEQDSEKIPSPMVRSASDVILNVDPFNTTTENLKSSSDIVSKMIEDEKDYSIYSKCAAEFIAVLLFVYIGSMQAAGGGDGVLHAAFAHGVAIFVLAATFGGVSGAHINPAVTFGIAIVGRINPIHAVCYIASQLLGSVFGALLVRISLNYKTYFAIGAGATLCGRGIGWQEGLTAEIVTTYILVQTVLLCAVDTDKNRLAPLAIGFSLVIEILAAGAISGASMNPARSFGPNIMGQFFLRPENLDSLYMFWNYHWIYYIGPVIGAFIAAGVYRLFFARDYRVLA